MLENIIFWNVSRGITIQVLNIPYLMCTKAEEVFLTFPKTFCELIMTNRSKCLEAYEEIFWNSHNILVCAKENLFDIDFFF